MDDNATANNSTKDIIARNIAQHRKRLGLTQAELAEKISFSDKSVSKWERGDGVPDLETVIQMAKIFGTTVDTLISEEATIIKKIPKKLSETSKKYITMLSVGLVWVVFTALFVLLGIINSNIPAWLCFVYAVPVSAIVLIIFTTMWGKYWQTATAVSGLIWALTTAIFLTFTFERSWLFFIACIPLQVLVIIWYIFRSHKRKEGNAKNENNIS